MKATGLLLTFIGVVFGIYAFTMDVSVSSSRGYGRVNNIGLMNDQGNYLMISGFIILIGVILIIFSKNKSEDKDRQEVLKTKKEQEKTLSKDDIYEEKEKNHTSLKLKETLSKHQYKLGYLESSKASKGLSKEEISTQITLVNTEIKSIENMILELEIKGELKDEMKALDDLLSLDIIDKEEYSKRENELIESYKKANNYSVINREKIDSFKYGTLTKEKLEFEDGVIGIIFTINRNKNAYFEIINENSIDFRIYKSFEMCVKAFRLHKDQNELSQVGFIKRGSSVDTR